MSASLNVSEKEGGIAINVTLEDDGSLLSSKLDVHFVDSSGLRFRHVETNTIRGLRCVDGKFYPPASGWEDCVHFCGGLSNYSKRKAVDAALEEVGVASAKAMRIDQKPTDLILLGLKKETTEDHIRDCFGKFGELELVSIKRDADGVSKGFGFIRFAKYESQKTVLDTDSHFYLVNGRWCEVKIPLSKIKSRTDSASQESKYLESKIFVGRCASDITPADLRQYFSRFGEVTHVYVPPNRAKPYAFVTFKDHDVARRLWGEDHTIKGNSVNVRPAERADSQNASQARNAFQRNAPSTSQPAIIQNARLTNEVLTQIRDITENQDGDQINRLCQHHRPCMYTNMLSKKLTLSSLIKILQSQGQLLSAVLDQNQASQLQGNGDTLSINQIQQPAIFPAQSMLGNNSGYLTSAGAGYVNNNNRQLSEIMPLSPQSRSPSDVTGATSWRAFRNSM